MAGNIFSLPYKGLAVIIGLYCFLYIFSLVLGRPPPIYYSDDTMVWTDKVTIMHLSDDLFKDSLLKMRLIVELRKHHVKTVAFNIGMIMGRVREKYRHMLEIYRDIFVSYSNLTLARPPSVKYFRTFHLVIALEMMHYLELEIDKLVDVIIDEAAEDVKENFNIAGQAKILKQKANGTEIPPPEDKRLLRGGEDKRNTEEAEKSMMRQRYLMKKLGHPSNMTTMKKRFINHWPVEESWQLDKYNYNYK